MPMKTIRLLIAAFLLLVPALLQASEPSDPSREDGAYVQPDSKSNPRLDRSNNDSLPGNTRLETRRVISGTLNNYLELNHHTSPKSKEEYKPLNPIRIHW